MKKESTVSTSGSGGPPLDKPVTADEVEYLITELKSAERNQRYLKKTLILSITGNLNSFFLKDTIAAKAVFDA